MSDKQVVQGDECSCDVCAEFRAEWTSLSGGQKLERVLKDASEHDAAYWKGYAEELEAQNYDLQAQLDDADRELGELQNSIHELEAELDDERARCQNCGKHK